MQAEITDHLGYPRNAAAGKNSGSSRNGSYKKKLKGDFARLSSRFPVIGTTPSGKNGMQPILGSANHDRTTGSGSFRILPIRVQVTVSGADEYFETLDDADQELEIWDTGTQRKRIFGVKRKNPARANLSDSYIFLLVRPEGFEPPTPGFEGRCSIQLSYKRTNTILSNKQPTTPRYGADWKVPARPAP